MLIFQNIISLHVHTRNTQSHHFPVIHFNKIEVIFETVNAKRQPHTLAGKEFIGNSKEMVQSEEIPNTKTEAEKHFNRQAGTNTKRACRKPKKQLFPKT